MAKRYGRKQRRQARQEIEELGHALQNALFERSCAKNTVEQLSRDLSKFHEVDKDIARLMGTDPALRLVQRSYDYQDLPDVLRTPTYTPLSIRDFNPSVSMENVITVNNLRKLYMEMNRDPTQYRNIIKLRASNGKQAAIYCDQDSMDRYDERDIAYLAEDLTRQLYRYFKGYK